MHVYECVSLSECEYVSVACVYFSHVCLSVHEFVNMCGSEFARV